MGAILPLAILIAAYIGAAVAVIAAIETVAIIAIIAAIVAVASSAAATYFYVQGDMKNCMLFAGLALAAGIGGVYVTYLGLAAESSALMAEGTVEAIATAEAIGSTYTMQAVAYVQTIYGAWQEIAAALHLKLLFQIHQIAYLVSADYREMMSRVFAQVAEVSNAFGFGALTLNLLFENVRTSVLDISTAMGESYDIAQIKWISTYSELLKEFNLNSQKYMRDPNAFLMWIADNTNRPGYDAKGVTMRSLMQGIDSSLALIKGVVESGTKIKNDLTKLVADLPEVIKKQVWPEISKINKQIDDFMRLSYDPAMKMIDSTFKALGDDLGLQKTKAAELATRLKRPGKYLKEIDQLPDEERIEDEDSLFHMANRSGARNVEGLHTEIKHRTRTITEEQLEEIKALQYKGIVVEEIGVPFVPRRR